MAQVSNEVAEGEILMRKLTEINTLTEDNKI